MEKITVKAQCPICEGTGICGYTSDSNDTFYGIGVICSTCDGRGMKKIDYVPFKQRKLRSNITEVCLGDINQKTIEPVYTVIGSNVSYKEFLAGKMPQRLP